MGGALYLVLLQGRTSANGNNRCWSVTRPARPTFPKKSKRTSMTCLVAARCSDFSSSMLGEMWSGERVTFALLSAQCLLWFCPLLWSTLSSIRDLSSFWSWPRRMQENLMEYSHLEVATLTVWTTGALTIWLSCWTTHASRNYLGTISTLHRDCTPAGPHRRTTTSRILVLCCGIQK